MNHEAYEQLEVLDNVSIALLLNRAVKEQFGESSVPLVSHGPDGTYVSVRGSDGEYLVVIEKVG